MRVDPGGARGLESGMVKLTDHLLPGGVLDLAASTKSGAIQELTAAAGREAPFADAERFLKAVVARENVMSTGVGDGIALPHARSPEVKRPFAVIGRSKRGIDYKSVDGKPVHFVVLIGAPDRQTSVYLQLLSKSLGVLVEPGVREKLMDAAGPDEMRRILSDVES